MTASAPEFRFSQQPSAEAGPDDLAVPVREGLHRKRRLLGVLARGLKFPDYFGWNWDAFDECLRDLSWIEDAKRIVLVHADVPFVAGSNSRRTYLEILRDAVRAGEGRLAVVFPASVEREVAAALSES